MSDARILDLHLVDELAGILLLRHLVLAESVGHVGVVVEDLFAFGDAKGSHGAAQGRLGSVKENSLKQLLRLDLLKVINAEVFGMVEDGERAVVADDALIVREPAATVFRVDKVVKGGEFTVEVAQFLALTESREALEVHLDGRKHKSFQVVEDAELIELFFDLGIQLERTSELMEHVRVRKEIVSCGTNVADANKGSLRRVTLRHRSSGAMLSELELLMLSLLSLGIDPGGSELDPGESLILKRQMIECVKLLAEGLRATLLRSERDGQCKLDTLRIEGNVVEGADVSSLVNFTDGLERRFVLDQRARCDVADLGDSLAQQYEEDDKGHKATHAGPWQLIASCVLPDRVKRRVYLAKWHIIPELCEDSLTTRVLILELFITILGSVRLQLLVLDDSDMGLVRGHAVVAAVVREGNTLVLNHPDIVGVNSVAGGGRDYLAFFFSSLVDVVEEYGTVLLNNRFIVLLNQWPLKTGDSVIM